MNTKQQYEPYLGPIRMVAQAGKGQPRLFDLTKDSDGNPMVTLEDGARMNAHEYARALRSINWRVRFEAAIE